jgi:glutamate-1-semialdehyde aminotransferase
VLEAHDVAAVAVLDRVADGSVLRGLAQVGGRLRAGLDAMVAAHDVGHLVTVGGEPQRTVVGCAGDDPDVVRSHLQQHLLLAGALFNGSLFVSAAHTPDDVDRTVAAFDDASRALAAAPSLAAVEAGLLAPRLRPVFRKP